MVTTLTTTPGEEEAWEEAWEEALEVTAGDLDALIPNNIREKSDEGLFNQNGLLTKIGHFMNKTNKTNRSQPLSLGPGARTISGAGSCSIWVLFEWTQQVGLVWWTSSTKDSMAELVWVF